MEALIVRTEQPFNAETPLGLLVRSHVTPTPLFFVRNHGSVPVVDAGAYRLTVRGDERLVLSLEDLRERWPRTTVTATIACAGNRRSELDRIAEGVPWRAGAIGTAVWSGVRLADLLDSAGVPDGTRHVAFAGLDAAHGSEVFAGSIPLAKALAPEVLVADEMNGEPLTPDHGFPVRVVVPGYIGARSVKWLEEISFGRSPSSSFFQVDDYALGGTPLGEQVLNSAFSAETGRGYAAGARPIERVEISADGGESWTAATLETGGGPWEWRLWSADVDRAAELLVRAWDSTGESQPETAEWNERGYMNNAWARVRLESR